MQGRRSLITSLAALAAVLGCGPAQGADSMKLKVSAVVQARITCNAGVRRASVSPCTSSDPSTTYRIRRERGGNGAVVLSIEP